MPQTRLFERHINTLFAFLWFFQIILQTIATLFKTASLSPNSYLGLHFLQFPPINGTLQIHLTIKTIRSLLSAAHYLPLPPPPTSASRRARCRILLRSAGALVGIIKKGVSHHQTNIHPTSNVLRSPKTNITIKDLVSFFAPKLFRQCKQC